jgi:hypothetical protein
LQRLLAIGIKGLVRDHIYEVLAQLGRFFREICSKTLTRSDVKHLKNEIPEILCNLELIYPPVFFDVMVHLAVHLPDEALQRGPVEYGWMYPIECRLCTFKNIVRSRARAEACIAEAYIAWEGSTYYKRHLADIDPTSNQGQDQYKDDINEARGCVF